MIVKKLVIVFLAASIFSACNTGTNETPSTESTTETPATNEPGFDVAAMTAGIDAMRTAIEENLDSYQKVEISNDQFREKTRQKWEKIDIYLEDGAVMRIKSYPHAGISKRTEEFYFDKGNLILAVIEDNGETVSGNEEVDKLIYFHNGEAFSEVSKGNEQEWSTLKAEGEELYEETLEYMELLKKNQ